MLTVNHQYATVPDYVIRNYKSHITDKELILLMTLQCIPINGKASWALAAEYMGYTSIGPVQKMLNGMAARGIVCLDKYNVDATPLWDTCMDTTSTPAVIVPKTKPPSISQPIYVQIKDIVTGTPVAWHTTIKRLIKRGLTDVEIVNLIKYIHGYQSAVAARYAHEFTEPVTVWLVEKRLQQWIEKGKPDKYTSLPQQQQQQKKKSFADL